MCQSNVCTKVGLARAKTLQNCEMRPINKHTRPQHTHVIIIDVNNYANEKFVLMVDNLFVYVLKYVARSQQQNHIHINN